MRTLLAVSIAVFALAACSSGQAKPVDVPATVMSTPTPTPIPDSDGDGLTDHREFELGTNPFQRDSDIDGLDDGQEVNLGTDPLFPDTDRDGVVDGDDVLPLADANLRVSIIKFTDTTQRSFLHGDTNAYFTFIVAGHDPITTSVYPDVINQTIAPVIVNVPDDLREIKVGILAQESTPLSNMLSDAVPSMLTTAVIGIPIPIKTNSADKPYDISRMLGVGLDAKILLAEVTANSSVEVTGSGTGDGDRLKAMVRVKVEHGAN